MRKNPTDILDVTGATYTYLMNQLPPDGNWTARFRPGERPDTGSTQALGVHAEPEDDTLRMVRA